MVENESEGNVASRMAMSYTAVTCDMTLMVMALLSKIPWAGGLSISEKKKKIWRKGGCEQTFYLWPLNQVAPERPGQTSKFSGDQEMERSLQKEIQNQSQDQEQDSSVSRGAMDRWWYALSCMPNTKPEWTRAHPPWTLHRRKHKSYQVRHKYLHC